MSGYDSGHDGGDSGSGHFDGGVSSASDSSAVSGASAGSGGFEGSGGLEGSDAGKGSDGGDFSGVFSGMDGGTGGSMESVGTSESDRSDAATFAGMFGNGGKLSGASGDGPGATSEVSVGGSDEFSVSHGSEVSTGTIGDVTTTRVSEVNPTVPGEVSTPVGPTVEPHGTGNATGKASEFTGRAPEVNPGRNSEVTPFTPTEVRMDNPTETTACTPAEVVVPGSNDREGTLPTIVDTTGKVSDEKVEAGKDPIAEIDFKQFPPETLERVEQDCANLSFRNGEGVEMTYTEALSAMTDDLSAALDRMQAEGREITPEQREAILSDVKTAVLSQQAESESRAIGNHGIPHIYGNYERLRDTPQEVLEKAAEQIRERNPESTATADDIRIGMIVVCAYHDEGYLSERASGGKAEGGRSDDSMHGVDSAIAFEHTHAPSYAGVVDQAVLDEAVQAMAEHNVLSQKSIDKLEAESEPGSVRLEMLQRVDAGSPAVMDPNQGFLRSALLLSDKAATDADEKLPDALRTPEASRVLAEFYDRQNSGELTEESAAKAREEMRSQLTGLLRQDARLSDEQRERMIDAVEKDISARRPNPSREGGVTKGSYDFDFPMSGMSTPKDALTFSLDEEGQIQAHVTMRTRVNDEIYAGIYQGDRSPTTEGKPELLARKAAGQLEDMGITRDTLPDDTAGWLTPTADGEGFVVDTSGISQLEHVTVELRDVTPENPKSEISASEREIETTLEARAELRQEVARQSELYDEAYERLSAARASGTLSTSDIAAFCAEVYDEHNKDELDRIAAELADGEVTQAQLQHLAERAAAVRSATYEELLAERSKAPETPPTEVDTLTPQERATLEEMYKSGELQPDMVETHEVPTDPREVLPTEKSGAFEGERGNSVFHPSDAAAMEALGRFGLDGIEYIDGEPDFKPVSVHDSEWGAIDTEVEIGHMTASRANPAMEEGRRPAGSRHDPNLDLGNFAQADNALRDRINAGRDPGDPVTSEQIESWRKANDLVWHELRDGKTMQLVPRSIHEACRHSGGVSTMRTVSAYGSYSPEDSTDDE